MTRASRRPSGEVAAETPAFAFSGERSPTSDQAERIHLRAGPPMGSFDRHHRVMQQKTPRGGLMRWLSPTEDSSWLQLRAHVVIWSLLAVLWISWEFWGDGTAMHRLLGILLTVLSIIQALSAVGLMRRKREHEPRG